MSGEQRGLRHDDPLIQETYNGGQIPAPMMDKGGLGIGQVAVLITGAALLTLFALRGGLKEVLPD